MDDRATHQLEGLLKARAEGLRGGRRPRVRQHVDGSGIAGPRPTARGGDPPSRTCAECSVEIPSPRLRAMPGAARCLTCQRAAELAVART